jgi:hypothetical protein
MKAPGAVLGFSLSVVACLVAGCAAEPTQPGSESSVADLEASPLPHGFYGLSGEVSAFRWINLLNLHDDGSFEASLGSNASGLSGRQFNASGTYEVKSVGGKPALELRYEFFGPRLEQYVIGGTASAPQLQLDHGDGTLGVTFSLRPLPAPATIHFDANAAPHADSSIGHGVPILLMYDANRAQCPLSEARESVFMRGEAPGAPLGQNQIAATFPNNPVNGTFRLLVWTPPAGPKLSLWFRNVTFDSSGMTCEKWDSNFGANFSFDMQ